MLRLRNISVIALAFAFFVGCAPMIEGQNNAPGIADNAVPTTKSENAVLITISEYERPSRDILTPSIEQFGFKPPSQSVWASSPAIAKLTAFVQAAENAQAGSGALALAAIADDLSRRHDGLSRDPEVRRYVSQNLSKQPIRFSYVGPFTLSSLSVEEENIISKISRVSGGKLGGPDRILTSQFGISQRRAFIIVANSKSIHDALVQGLLSLEKAERPARMITLVNAAERSYPGFAFNKSFVDYRNANGLVKCYCESSTGAVKRDLGWLPPHQCVDGTPC